jgi:hypothetical protein
MAMSVNILRCPERSESQPRTKNGQPHHSTAGIAIANCSHCLALADKKGRRSMPKTWLPMSRASRTSESGTAIVSRRMKSISSGLSVISGGTPIGSSAMPQIGQWPGPSFTISGCIGHV